MMTFLSNGFFYLKNWNENAKAETENLLNKTRTFVDVISYIHLVIKFIEIIVFYITYIYQKKAGNPRVSISTLTISKNFNLIFLTL